MPVANLLRHLYEILHIAHCQQTIALHVYGIDIRVYNITNKLLILEFAGFCFHILALCGFCTYFLNVKKLVKPL